MFNRNRIIVPRPTKLNLVPIMDAIFLFVFFLLTSSQMIKFFEISSDAPVVQESSNKENDNLHLRVVLEKDLITIKKGLEEILVRQVSLGNLDKGLVKFREELLEIKRKKPIEKEIVLAPASNVDFQLVVKVMDLAKEKHVVSNGGDAIPLFPNIILEPLK